MNKEIDTENKLGKEIERRRIELALSQRELAEKSNVAYTTIKSVEDGSNKKVKLNTLKKIAKGLNCNLINIFRSCEN